VKRARYKTGSVVFDKRRRTWNYLQWIDGKRRSQRIGTLHQFRTKNAAQQAAQALKVIAPMVSVSPTVKTVVERYRTEKMPERFSTRYGYNAWLKNHVLPCWENCPITDMQARPVELWLRTLKLSPKSRVAIRGVISILWDFSMWRGDIPTQRNPMELVTIRGSSKRTRKPRSLAVEEFRKFVHHLQEPFRTIALLCVCFGLRISECLALKWSDVDWLNCKLSIRRAIVRQHVDDVKTTESQRAMHIDTDMLELMKTWKQATQFPDGDDWMFASPTQLGRLPWSYPQVWRVFQMAAADSKVGDVSTHTMRHSYRAWLDAVGTPIAVQQKLMRHADIRTTMNVYGDVVTDEMAKAHARVVDLALSRA